MVKNIHQFLGLCSSEDRNGHFCSGKTVCNILHSHRLEKCPSHSGELFPALSKYCQILRNIVKCCQKLPYIAKYSLMLVNIDKYCQMLSNITKCFKIMTNIAQWCKGSQLMSDVVKCCQILPDVAKCCQTCCCVSWWSPLRIPPSSPWRSGWARASWLPPPFQNTLFLSSLHRNEVTFFTHLFAETR